MPHSPGDGDRHPPSASRPIRILVNCANQHEGGALAVETSFVAGLCADPPPGVTVLASDELHANLAAMDVDTDVLDDYIRFNTYGLGALWTRKPVRFADFDVVFTVFGPLYGTTGRVPSVVGFAQPWVLYPNNLVYRLLNRRTVYTQRIKYAIHAWFFSRADVLVVEHDSVRYGLKSLKRFRRKHIEVVPNAVDPVFSQPQRWEPVVIPPKRSALRLGYVSRAFRHKNLDFLPRVKQSLSDDFGLDVEFCVTLTPQELEEAPEDLRAAVTTVGSLRLPQVPTFLDAMDGVFFPSLLECFSASPLEALVMGKPLFASDLPFIRGTVGDRARYFDPMDAYSAAAAIAGVFGPSAAPNLDSAQADRRWVLSTYSATSRVSSYLEICRRAVGSEVTRPKRPRSELTDR